MFVRTIRISFAGGTSEATIKLFNERVKPMWSSQPGFHSIQRFKVIEGPNKDQEMVVLRFNSHDDYKKALEALADKREALQKDIQAAGVKQEENMMLEEIT